MSMADFPVPLSLALSPSDEDAVPALLEDISHGADKWRALHHDEVGVKKEQARHDLLIKARSLVQALETPRETMLKHCWAQPGAISALTCGTDRGLWTLMARNGDRPQTVDELAKALDWDSELLGRMMRHLAAMGYIRETGADEYRPTNFSKAMSLDEICDTYFPLLVIGGAGAMEFVNFAKRTGYKNPVDAADTPTKQAHRTELDFFAFNESRGYGPHFNHHMRGYRQGRLPWMHPHFFPVRERLIEGADESPDSPFLVDIGGNIGHDLTQFQAFHPGHPGRLILQDMAVVVGQVEALDDKIERMNHDFFAEQPVKGARAYYMHSVLHDWPDDKCNIILSRLTEAMKRGYSKLLINENVIPSTDAWWETTGLDMVMMNLCSSKERTDEDWKVLLGCNGLKIIKVWSVAKGVESLIECELA